jgi:hypothetical protein
MRGSKSEVSDHQRLPKQTGSNNGQSLLRESHRSHVQSYLRNTGEKNYCLSLYLGEKGKLIRYLHERGASEYQISSVFDILADTVRE